MLIAELRCTKWLIWVSDNAEGCLTFVHSCTEHLKHACITLPVTLLEWGQVTVAGRPNMALIEWPNWHTNNVFIKNSELGGLVSSVPPSDLGIPGIHLSFEAETWGGNFYNFYRWAKTWHQQIQNLAQALLGKSVILFPEHSLGSSGLSYCKQRLLSRALPCFKSKSSSWVTKGVILQESETGV